MHSTRLTYLAMVLVFGTALWGILRIGSRLHAARNVSGDWNVRWNAAPPDSNLPARMSVAQSGRFLTVTLWQSDRKTSVKLHGQLTSSPREPQTRLVLHGSSASWEMSGSLDDRGQLLSGHLDSPVSCDWQARRESQSRDESHS